MTTLNGARMRGRFGFGVNVVAGLRASEGNAALPDKERAANGTIPFYAGQVFETLCSGPLFYQKFSPVVSFTLSADVPRYLAMIQSGARWVCRYADWGWVIDDTEECAGISTVTGFGALPLYNGGLDTFDLSVVRIRSDRTGATQPFEIFMLASSGTANACSAWWQVSSFRDMYFDVFPS